MTEPKRIEFKRPFQQGEPATAIGFFHAHTGLSKSALKDAMNKGAAWLTRQKQRRRLRRATTELRGGDLLELHYDSALLALAADEARLVEDRRRFSVWFKPAGLLAQGTDFGDHMSLERQVEKALERPVLLVHRLDREACGLMVVAHERDAAARLSKLFAGDGMEKHYRVQVRGQLQNEGRVEQHLDGKPALTQYRALAHDTLGDTTTLDVRIHTGRLHQIRRHLESIGHPVMGDPRYGRGNKNTEGLRLAAVELAFADPFSKEMLRYVLTPDDVGF